LHGWRFENDLNMNC